MASDSLPLAWRGFTGRVRPGIDPAAILELIGADPLRLLPDRAEAEFIKAKYDKGSRVYRLGLDLGAGPEELFLKTFDAAEVRRIMARRMFSTRGLRRPLHYPEKLLKMFFAPSLAGRCWAAAAAGERAGLAVAEPLLYLSRGRAMRREEVLVCRGINPRSAADALEYFNRNFAAGKPPGKRARKKELIRELGRLLWQVRASRIKFPDFKLHNLVLREPPDGPPRFVVVDLSEAELDRPDYPEAVFLERFGQSLPPGPAFTCADRVRLLKAYLEAGSDLRPWPELARQVQQRARSQGRA